MKYKVYTGHPDQLFDNQGACSIAYFNYYNDATDYANMKKEMGRKILVVLLDEKEIDYLTR